MYECVSSAPQGSQQQIAIAAAVHIHQHSVVSWTVRMAVLLGHKGKEQHCPRIASLHGEDMKKKKKKRRKKEDKDKREEDKNAAGEEDIEG